MCRLDCLLVMFAALLVIGCHQHSQSTASSAPNPSVEASSATLPGGEGALDVAPANEDPVTDQGNATIEPGEPPRVVDTTNANGAGNPVGETPETGRESAPLEDTEKDASGSADSDPQSGSPSVDAETEVAKSNSADDKTSDASQTNDGKATEPKKTDPKQKPDPRLQGRLFQGGKPGDVISISFEDINLGMPADVAFRPFMLSDRAKSLDGKRVRIKGFVMATDRTKGIKEFVLLRNTECKFGPGGKADHLLRVFMKKGQTADYRSKPISIEGVLRIKPFPDARQTWSVFDLEDAEKIVNATR